MPGEIGLGASAVDGDRDRGDGGVGFLVVVMNQIVVSQFDQRILRFLR